MAAVKGKNLVQLENKEYGVYDTAMKCFQIQRVTTETISDKHMLSGVYNK